ncbi:MAG: HD domain-containing protein, partial [Candidatus Eremiobacteraeota bacterium]|nr:HD domain-containing protein [Candidatus Eremiobacteraeota bacterium]NNM93185.1 HD domain-containing protein [Candidatus Eremiobacteraeota bacterium]
MTQVDRAIHAAVEVRDEYTAVHGLQVARLAEELGRAIVLDSDEIEALREAAHIHDVGKIGIPDYILLKSAPLSSYEWEIMKNHSALGARIIAAQSSQHWKEMQSSTSIVKAILHHHEHFDGKGYPDGLAGDAIPLWSRIILIADCYDALTETRAYRPSLPHESALELMAKERGRVSDPELFDVFARTI